MKGFLIKLSGFLLVLVLLTGTVNAAYVARFGYPGTYSRERFAQVPTRIDIAVFGSSHREASFDEKQLGQDRTVFKFTAGNQSLSYDVRLLEHYRDRLSEGGCAIITVSYMSFFGIPETQTREFASHNTLYYWSLPPELIKDYDLLTAICIRHLPSLSAYFDIMKLLRTPQPKKEEQEEELTKQDLYMSDIGGMTDAGRVAETVGIRYEQHFIREKLDAEGNRIVNREEIDALYRMIEICREEGVRPVLVTTPVIAEYSALVHEKDPAFFEEFYGILDAVCNETGAEYFDYSEDARFVFDYSLFADNDHLNAIGNDVFTKAFAEEVLGITPP